MLSNLSRYLLLAVLLLQVPIVKAEEPVAAATPAPSVIRIAKMVIYDIDHEDYYFYRLLQLVLRKSEPEFGPYVIDNFRSS